MRAKRKFSKEEVRRLMDVLYTFEYGQAEFYRDLREGKDVDLFAEHIDVFEPVTSAEQRRGWMSEYIAWKRVSANSRRFGGNAL